MVLLIWLSPRTNTVGDKQFPLSCHLTSSTLGLTWYTYWHIWNCLYMYTHIYTWREINIILNFKKAFAIFIYNCIVFQKLIHCLVHYRVLQIPSQEHQNSLSSDWSIVQQLCSVLTLTLLFFKAHCALLL